MPRNIRRRTLDEDLEFKINLMQNNPTELYLMVVRNEFTIEDFAKIFLRVIYDLRLDFDAERFAKLILQDEDAASKEVFRIMSEIDESHEANFEREYAEAIVWADFEDAYEERYWAMVEEEWRLEEQTKREIREYMESDDSV